MRDFDPNEVKQAAIKALVYWKPGRDPIVRVAIPPRFCDLTSNRASRIWVIEFAIREIRHNGRSGIGAFLKGIDAPFAHYAVNANPQA